MFFYLGFFPPPTTTTTFFLPVGIACVCTSPPSLYFQVVGEEEEPPSRNAWRLWIPFGFWDVDGLFVGGGWVLPCRSNMLFRGGKREIEGGGRDITEWRQLTHVPSNSARRGENPRGRQQRKTKKKKKRIFFFIWLTRKVKKDIRPCSLTGNNAQTGRRRKKEKEQNSNWNFIRGGDLNAPLGSCCNYSSHLLGTVHFLIPIVQIAHARAWDHSIFVFGWNWNVIPFKSISLNDLDFQWKGIWSSRTKDCLFVLLLWRDYQFLGPRLAR